MGIGPSRRGECRLCPFLIRITRYMEGAKKQGGRALSQPPPSLFSHLLLRLFFLRRLLFRRAICSHPYTHARARTHTYIHIRVSASIHISLVVLRRRVLGHGLGTLGDGMLRKLTGKAKTDGGLNFPARERLALVVSRETDSFRGETVEGVVYERVHDRHGSARDSGVRVHLLEYLVNVRGVGFDSSLSSLLHSSLLGGLCGFRRSFCHFTC